MKDDIIVLIIGVWFGAIMIIAMLPSPNEVGCNFVGEVLDIRTVLVDNSDCLIETESGFITLQNYIGE